MYDIYLCTDNLPPVNMCNEPIQLVQQSPVPDVINGKQNVIILTISICIFTYIHLVNNLSVPITEPQPGPSWLTGQMAPQQDTPQVPQVPRVPLQQEEVQQQQHPDEEDILGIAHR